MTKQKDKGAPAASKEAAENPEDLKASQLMDAIDDLYGAV